MVRTRRCASPQVRRHERRPGVGGSRFLQVDPVKGGSWNDYDYAEQDPINQFDLDGRCCGLHHIGHFLKKHWVDVALTVATIAAPEAAGAIWAYRGYRAMRMIEEVEEASVAYRGMSLAARAGRNRVSISTPRGRYHFDLMGKSHGGVRTPHYTYQPRNPMSPHGWGKTGRQAYPMTHEHMRWVGRMLD